MAVSRTTTRPGGQLLGLDETANTEDLNSGEGSGPALLLVYILAGFNGS